MPVPHLFDGVAVQESTARFRAINPDSQYRMAASWCDNHEC